MLRWPSGKAAVSKTAHTGSNPVRGAKEVNNKKTMNYEGNGVWRQTKKSGKN